MYLKNEKGEDLIFYRGERTSPDIGSIRSRLPAIYFGEIETANAYALEGHFIETPRVFPVKLTMSRPFINQPNDPYLEISALAERLGADKAYELTLKYAELIEETDHWRYRINSTGQYCSVEDYLEQCSGNGLKELYFQAYPFFTDLANIQLLVKLGYDGAIHGGNGNGSAGKPEHCVFDKSQIHYLFHKEVIHG